MTKDEQTLRRLLVNQRLRELNGLLDVLFQPESRRARSKRDAVSRIFEAPGGVSQIVAAVRSRASEGTFEEPRVFQHLTTTVGALGVRASSSSRTSAEGLAVASLLFRIAERHGDERLERVLEAAPTVTDDVRAALRVIKKPKDRRVALVHALLTPSTDSLAEAINSTGDDSCVLDLEPGNVYRGVEYLDLPWYCSRFGVVPHEPWDGTFAEPPWFDPFRASHRLACVLAALGTNGNRAALPEGASLEDSVRLIMQVGPREVLERWLSNAELWFALRAWGLRLPRLHSTSVVDLRELFHLCVGLAHPDEPSGWYSLSVELENPTSAASSNSFDLFRRVEHAFTDTLSAYVARLFVVVKDEMPSVKRVSGPDGVEVLASALGATGSNSLRRRTFGQQKRLMEELIRRLTREETLAASFREVGCDVDTARVLCGPELEELVTLRNQAAHGHEEVTAGRARDAVLKWLRAARVLERPTIAFPLPIRVRHDRSETDVHGWQKVWFVDELGRRHLAADEDWVFDRSDTPYAFGDLGDVVHGAILVGP